MGWSEEHEDEVGIGTEAGVDGAEKAGRGGGGIMSGLIVVIVVRGAGSGSLPVRQSLLLLVREFGLLLPVIGAGVEVAVEFEDPEEAAVAAEEEEELQELE